MQPVCLSTSPVFLTYRLVSAESWRSSVTLPVCLSMGSVFLTYRSVSAESWRNGVMQPVCLSMGPVFLTYAYTFDGCISDLWVWY